MIKCAYKNILESSVVTLSAGTEDGNYPLYRLYDRDIGRLFKTSAVQTVEVLVDQGATGNVAVDRLLIPSGHNLDGTTLDILYSDDDLSYYAATAQWSQGGAGLINKSWTALTKRYWKFKITSPSSAPQFAEMFLTSTYEWKRNPARPTGPLDDVFNVEHGQTASGQDRFLVHGEEKRKRVYHMPRCDESQKESILALNDTWAGSKPFWLEDHEGNWIYGYLQAPLNLEEIAYRSYSFDFDFLEVLQ